MVQTNRIFSCRAFRLGIIDYEKVLQIQNRLAEARMREELSDVLLLLQHFPVITMGKSGKVENILAPQTLNEKRIQVIFTDRGGDVTYHGPGQLVIYPILNLGIRSLNLHEYVWKLEEMTIRLLSHFGISAGRMEGLRGVWVGNEKIAALGIHLSRRITRHGLALNVNTNLDHFELINPCGTGKKATSMARILKKEIPMEEIEAMMIQSFGKIFSSKVYEESFLKLESYR
jgi:lipoyl(octanoyl) transferase